jgi:hypothetical protein
MDPKVGFGGSRMVALLLATRAEVIVRIERPAVFWIAFRLLKN